jgi:hypothetical protein
MERLWLGDARLKYPKQWIVATNLNWEAKNKVYGDIFLVTADKDEAYAKAAVLKKEEDYGKVTVSEGFNDTPQIGGFEICRQ